MQWPYPHHSPLGGMAEKNKTVFPKNGRYAYFALTGFSEEQEELDIVIAIGKTRAMAVIRPVDPVPTPEALSKAITEPLLAGRLLPHCPYLRHEIEIDREAFDSDDQAAFMVRFIRWFIPLRAVVALHIPAVSDRSWSKLHSLTDNSCEIVMVDDRRTQSIFAPGYLDEEDNRWLAASYRSALKLQKENAFALGTAAMSTVQYLADHSMAIALLWSALEGLVPVEHELPFRLSVTVASVLRPRGKSRTEYYRMMRNLYDLRSKVVHGEDLTEEELDHAFAATMGALSEILCKIVDMGNLPTRKELSQLLFE